MTYNKTIHKLITFLEGQPGSRPKSIADFTGLSRQYIQKILAGNKDLFTVTGSGPNRFYSLKNENIEGPKQPSNIPVKAAQNTRDRLINEHYYSLTPLGEELEGVEGLVRWCEARGYNFDAKVKEYVSIINKYYPPNLNQPIDFTDKLKNTFENVAIKKVWAVDYYNFEIFGKTKLGTQVMIAKQTGDEKITKELINKMNPQINKIIESYSIEAIAFVSPTIQRQSQLMSKLDNNIATQIPRIRVHKVGARILIAQKTLKSLEDRILNAAQTFVVESSNQYKNILIVDDALGSGATLNEIAKLIMRKKIAENCYGLVLVSSPSGYEIINEV